MAGENAEIRKLSFQVESTSLRNGLVKAGNDLNNFGSLVGKTDKQLVSAERRIEKLATAFQESAARVQRMKTAYSEMSKELTKTRTEAARLEARLNTANKRLTEQKGIMKSQGDLIVALARRNGELAQSYDKVASSAGRANAAVTKGVAAPAAAASPRPGVPSNVLSKQFNSSGKLLQSADGSFTQFGSSMTNANKKLEEAVGLSNSLRYQLYDVAATFGIMGTAALAGGTAIARVGIEWDKNFANVVRTSQVTGTAVDWLKEEFLQLQSAIPVSSADLATIATLGAQMGVSAATLADFTEVTAKFSATSGTSVDEAATALARLSQLLPDVAGNYELLASTILKTGVNAVATEQQIVRGTSQIAAMGRIAGLTTPEVVALSSTLSSLGFSPELQRSIVTSSFSKILTATSAVTKQTEKFGTVLNMTGEEFRTAWSKDAIGTYKDLVQTIAGREDAVTILQDLGLASQRLTPNLLKLGQNTDVLDEALADTREEWGQNGELTRQYGIIANTVSAKIQVLGQTWEALLVTLDTSETIIGPLVDGLTGFLKGVRAIANNPLASTFATIATGFATVAGLVVLGTAGLAAASAGYIAVQNAGHGLTLALAEQTVAQEVNTASTARNTAAKYANLGPTVQLQTATKAAAGANIAAAGATDVATAAAARNAAATGAAGTKMLKFTNGLIGAFPALLRGATTFGIIGAAVAGLGVALASAPEWTHEIKKGLAGVNDFQSSVDFNVDAYKEYQKELERTQKYIDDYTKAGNLLSADQEIGVLEGLKENGAVEIFKDLEEEIMGLDNFEDKLNAVNYVSKQMGITQQELLTKYLPGLGSALGDTGASAAVAQEELIALQSAQELWATSMGFTSDELKEFNKQLTAGAASYLNFTDSLKTAYDGNAKNGEGIGAFAKGISTQIKDFESFYDDLGELTQRGGSRLAGFFAAQGPAAAEALADSLKLDDRQLGKIEEQMSLAAFYASTAFTDAFNQNNYLLGEVFQQTGSTDAVAAFNKVLGPTLKGAPVDQEKLAELTSKYGVQLTVDAVPSIDPQEWDSIIALQGATITPIRVPVSPTTDGAPTNAVQSWVVEMEGNSIAIPVDPQTEQGKALIAEWRAGEYQTPVSLRTYASTTGADAKLQALRNKWNDTTINFNTSVDSLVGVATGRAPKSATGSYVGKRGLIYNNYPAYRNGTILRGPGTGTSDSIIARVSTGEAITRARAVRYYGTQMMEDINRMKFPKFATGGVVGGSSSGGSSAGTVVHATVVQNYPVTKDPIKTLKADAENAIAGIWI